MVEPCTEGVWLVDEETGNQKRERGLGPDRGSHELGGPDVTMGTRQVSSGSWLPCPYLVRFTDTWRSPTVFTCEIRE